MLSPRLTGWPDHSLGARAGGTQCHTRMDSSHAGLRAPEGLQPKSPAAEAAAIERISDRKLALHLQRASDGTTPPSDAELVEQWESSSSGTRPRAIRSRRRLRGSRRSCQRSRTRRTLVERRTGQLGPALPARPPAWRPPALSVRPHRVIPIPPSEEMPWPGR